MQQLFEVAYWLNYKYCPRLPRVEKFKKKVSSCCLGGKVGFYLLHPEKWVKLRKMKNFSSGGFLWMFSLGFGVLAIFLFQNLCLTSKSPMIGQFHVIFQNLENQLYQPPTVQEKFFWYAILNVPWGGIPQGVKTCQLEKSVPQGLCPSATMSLKKSQHY